MNKFNYLHRRHPLLQHFLSKRTLLLSNTLPASVSFLTCKYSKKGFRATENALTSSLRKWSANLGVDECVGSLKNKPWVPTFSTYAQYPCSSMVPHRRPSRADAIVDRHWWRGCIPVIAEVIPPFFLPALRLGFGNWLLPSDEKWVWPWDSSDEVPSI